MGILRRATESSAAGVGRFWVSFCITVEPQTRSSVTAATSLHYMIMGFSSLNNFLLDRG